MTKRSIFTVNFFGLEMREEYSRRLFNSVLLNSIDCLQGIHPTAIFSNLVVWLRLGGLYEQQQVGGALLTIPLAIAIICGLIG